MREEDSDGVTAEYDDDDVMAEYDDDAVTVDTPEDFDIYGEEAGQGPRGFQQKTRHYFIAAVEELWDYGVRVSPGAPGDRFVLLFVVVAFYYTVVCCHRFLLRCLL